MAGKVAVITGGGSGIGKAIALALTESVDTFVLVGRDLGKLEQVRVQLHDSGKLVHVMRVDLSSQKDLHVLEGFIHREFAKLDMLVHSAGGIRSGSVEASGADDLDWHYAVNLRGPFLLTQICLPLLRKDGGQIVFINSSAGLNAKPGLAAYCASKAALKALADSLRSEENVNGIRVLSVYPGRTATPMQQALFEMEGKTYIPEALLQPHDVAHAVVCAMNMPRTGEVTELMLRGMQKP